MKSLIIFLGMPILLISCQKDYECSCTTNTVTFSNQPNLTTAYLYDSIFSGNETNIETNEIIHATKLQAKKRCKEKSGGGYLGRTECKIK
jgi:hypothetical protein